MMKLTYLPLIAGICVMTTAACSIDVGGEEAVVTEENRFTVSGPAELRLTTFDGAIEVRSWDRNEVLVQIERRAQTREDAQKLEVKTTQDGNRIVIDASGGDNARFERRRRIHFGVWRSPSVSFIVSAPRQVTLTAQSGDGPIAASGLTGTLDFDTGDGPIRVDRVEGQLRAHTGDGPIELTDVRGGVELDSGDGPVQVTGQLENVRVHTGDGPVRAEALEGSAMKGDWSITTGDGPITLRLPSAFDAEVDAESGDGPVRVDGIGATSTIDADRGVARGRLGKGGRTLRVRSGDGRIEIQTR